MDALEPDPDPDPDSDPDPDRYPGTFTHTEQLGLRPPDRTERVSNGLGSFQTRVSQKTHVNGHGSRTDPGLLTDSGL